MTLAFILPFTIALHLAYTGMRVTLSLFALHLDASPFTVGVLLSLLAFLPMTFSIALGRLIDRIGVRRPMLAGAAALFAGIMVAAISPTLPALFVTSCLGGSGFILYHIAVNYLAAVVGRPENRAKNFSWLALSFSTSGFLGPIVAGYAIEWVGYQQTMLLLAGFALATLIALVAKRIEVPRVNFEQLIADDPQLQRIGLRLIFTDPSAIYGIFPCCVNRHGESVLRAVFEQRQTGGRF